MGRTACAEGCEARSKEAQSGKVTMLEETKRRVKAKLDKLPVGQKLPTLKAAIALARKILVNERGDPPTGKVIYVDFNKNRP